MFDAAEKDGVTLKSLSSYRSYNLQAILYDNKVADVINKTGVTREQAKLEAAKSVAVPGTSEHALGLTVDINSASASFDTTTASAWLKAHAAEHGFILRYPKDKQDITNIIYEPWHYRYVSPEHAKRMNLLGMCLEEYTAYIENRDT
jgi:D-alanyl-D-alanine carboxypeptidase